MAHATGGSYIRATNQSIGLNEIVAKINETQQTGFTATVFDEYDEYFQYLLGLGLLILLIDMIMLSRKRETQN